MLDYLWPLSVEGKYSVSGVNEVHLFDLTTGCGFQEAVWSISNYNPGGVLTNGEYIF